MKGARGTKGKNKIVDFSVWQMSWKGCSIASAMVGQLKFSQCMLYERVIQQIAIEAGTNGRSSYLAVIYDGHCRKHWEERFAVLREAFDVSRYMTSVDEHFLRLAKRDYDLLHASSPGVEDSSAASTPAAWLTATYCSMPC